MTNKTFLADIHAFRGIAILTIVGAHAWSFLIFWTGSLDASLKPVFWLTESLFHGSTLYFAIISGILFQRILINKSWQQFYQSKFNYVLLPFLLMSLLYTGVYWQYQADAAAQRGEEISFWLNYLGSLPGGNASIHFWYIPLLMFLFAITPLLKYLHQNAAWTMLVLAILPLLVSRSPFPDFLMPQSFVYFTGAYALGMLIGKHHQQILRKVQDYWQWLLAAVLCLTVMLYLQYATDFQPFSWISLRQSMVYMQKVGIALLLIWALHKIAHRIPGWMTTLGDYAFAIFFLHVIFVGFFIQSLSSFLQSERTGILFLWLGVVNLLLAVVASVLVSWLVKKIFKAHSRKIIGA